MQRKRISSRRWLVACVVAALAAIAVAACGGDDDDGSGGGELVIDSFGGAWGEALEVGFIEPFEAETGIDVTLLDSQDLAKTQAAVEVGKPPPVDISDGSAFSAAPLIQEDLLEPIDYSVFEDQVANALPEDVKGEYITGFAKVAYTFCYNKDAFPDGGPQPQTWADFWNEDKFPGGRALLTLDFDPVMEFALRAAGVPHEQLYPLDLDQAFAKFEELKPNVVKWTDSQGVSQQLLLDGEASIVTCFTHRAQTLLDQGVETIGISFEDVMLINETFMVWKDSPNRENAMEFIAWVMQPENQVRWAKIANASPANPEAIGQLDKDFLAVLPTSPEHEANTFIQDANYWLTPRPDGSTQTAYIAEELWPAFIEQ